MVERAVEHALDAVVDEAAHHMGKRRAFGQLEASVLEVEYRLPEGLALLRVFQRQLDRAFDRCGGRHAKEQALI